MSEIIIRTGFILGLISLIIYAVSAYIFEINTETHRWIISAVFTLILGIKTWKQIKQKK